MNTRKSIPLQDLDFDKHLEVVTEATARLAETDNIPSVTFPKAQKAKEEGTPVPAKIPPEPKPTGAAPTKRVPLELPDYAKTYINRRALELNVTNRYFIMDALRQAGVPIKDVDMIEDGRRVR